GDSSAAQTKGIHITVLGLAAGEKPFAVAEALRTKLADNFSQQFPKSTATFKSLDPSPDGVLIDGQKRTAANFTINLEMPLPDPTAKSDSRTAAATPPAARTKHSK